MKIVAKWNEKLSLTASADAHSVVMDSKPPLGSDAGMTPKQLVAAGLCGCTAMDVIALMKKHKQPLESFEIEADVAMTEGSHPIVFKSVLLTFKLAGALDQARVIESVQLSQTKFCGVSAMLSKAVPINYVVELNGQKIAEGVAKF